MFSVVLNNKTYNLVDNVYATSSYMSIVILKENHTVEEVVESFLNTENITVKRDDEVIRVYVGYDELSSAVLRKDQEIDSEGGVADTITLCINNSDFQVQLDTLNASMNNITAAQASQANTINDLNTAVNGKVDSSVISDVVETIGGKSNKPYEIGDTFMGNNGLYYKATATIPINSIINVGGNCEITNISSEVQNKN